MTNPFVISDYVREQENPVTPTGKTRFATMQEAVSATVLPGTTIYVVESDSVFIKKMDGFQPLVTSES